MKRLTPIFALLACLAAGPAFGGASTAGTSAGAATSGAGSSASSKTTSPDDKIVLQARDDAASFVATDGRIRGAQLEARTARGPTGSRDPARRSCDSRIFSP